MYQRVATRSLADRDAEGALTPNGHEHAALGRGPAGDGADRGPLCLPLAGTWRLRAAHRTDAAGRVATLYARDGAGAPAYYARYRDNGAVCLVAARAGRPALSPLDLIGVGNLLAEQVGAHGLRLASCGAYTCAAGVLTHHLDGRHFPAWLDLDRPHLVEPCGDALVWCAASRAGDGEPRTTRLVWERA
ncbi:MAG TPA: lipocalin-like domain-containing protein [Thermomicrobiales bacterium]|nr:lipocalin-like domain-containing protein [Thermomicrobiales bacterium]